MSIYEKISRLPWSCYFNRGHRPRSKQNRQNCQLQSSNFSRRGPFLFRPRWLLTPIRSKFWDNCAPTHAQNAQRPGKRTFYMVRRRPNQSLISPFYRRVRLWNRRGSLSAPRRQRSCNSLRQSTAPKSRDQISYGGKRGPCDYFCH